MSRSDLLLLVGSVVLQAAVAACGPSSATPAIDPEQPILFDVADPISSINLSPITMAPVFATTTHDYYVRCISGQPMTVTITTSTGAQSSPTTLVENQALVVSGAGESYWIRCVPSDFPFIITAPHTEVGTPTPGYYLVNSTPSYALVLDTNGTPVWYSRVASAGNVDALATDTISFTPLATGPYGYESAEDFDIHALDTKSVRHLFAVGSTTDSHELRLLPNGDYLLYSYPIESDIDLTGLQTFNAAETVADCEIQEIDPSGNEVWSWSAMDHVDPVQESLEPATNTIQGQSVVDPFHCNSIEVDASGNLLVSMRHTNAIFYVDRQSGTIQWKLGGSAYNKDGAKHISVVNDPEGAFNMQHDARFQPNGDVSMFDDHGATAGVARGVEYAIDWNAMTASVAFETLGTASSQYEGSFRRYADGHSVIGWGAMNGDARTVTEVDANGNAVLDITVVGGPSYRAIKVPLSQLDIDVLRTTVGD